MKKISNEIRIGVTAIITLVVFIWLYSFLKGKDILSSTSHYNVVYKEVGGLAESSPIEVSGYKVGVVQSIRFFGEGSDRLLVVLSVDKKIRIPVNSVAEITTASLIAGMKIQIQYSDNDQFYSSGDTIPGRLAESLIARMENELSPVKEKITGLIEVLDSVITSINDVMDPQFRNNIKSGVASLSNTARSVSEADLKGSLDNINRFTAMLAGNTEKMTNTFSNLESVTDTLAAADLYSSIANLKETLAKTTVLLENLNEGKGTAGQLMTNDSLYMNLSGSLESLNMLLQDLKANPKRYVHFSVFGRKNVPAQ